MAKFSEAWSAGTGPSAPQIKETTGNPNGGGAGLISALRRPVGERNGRMAISDELREWARDNTVQDKVLTTYPVQHPVHGTVESLLRIADRIDAEHERQMADAFETRNSDENLENDGWIRLPKDADGEYIHVGDVMESGDGGVFVVSSVDYRRHSSCGDGEFWMLWSEDADFYERADECHHHAPTVEDVLREFADKWMDVPPYREPEIIAEYAAKLQLREVDE